MESKYVPLAQLIRPIIRHGVIRDSCGGESLRNVTECGAIDPKETDDFQECYIAFLWRRENEQ
jgi:hypothetical protein